LESVEGDGDGEGEDDERATAAGSLAVRHDQLLENAEAAMIILSLTQYLGMGFALCQLGDFACALPWLGFELGFWSEGLRN